MPKELKSPENGVRTIFFLLGGGLTACSLYDVKMLPMAGLGIVMILTSAVIFPHITLTEEGVGVRRLIRTRLYRWTELQQVGIYETISRKLRDVTVRSYTFAMVLPGGIVKNEGTPFAHDQDSRYLIRLPVTPEIQAFIECHYGSMDFDARSAQP